MMSLGMLGIRHLLLFVLLGVWRMEAGPLVYRTAPVDNPLKGFVHSSGQIRAFPVSLSYRSLALSSLLVGPNIYQWGPLEKALHTAANEGNHLIFRVYMVWAGTDGIPAYFLTNGLAIQRNFEPDYSDPFLRLALTNFIAELGRKYDGDPRIGFIEAGLLGPWGEWKTWGASRDFATEVVQREILGAYQAAFRRTKVLVRFPDKLNAPLPFGYHDDWFARFTLPGNPSYLNKLKGAGAESLEKWRTYPVGGRLHPELSRSTSALLSGKSQDPFACIESIHLSWLRQEDLLARSLFRSGNVQGDPTEAELREQMLRMARKMGYEIHVSHANIPDLRDKEPWTVNLRLENRGVAPFYYDWPVELAVIDFESKPLETWRTHWKLTSVQPGRPLEWQWYREGMQLPRGSYRLLMRAVNPLPTGKPLRFANETQDQDREGWLTLGRFWKR